ncbi:MAG: hypothetical protein AAB757_01840 [Patescibacteria group bacterium]
MKNWLKENWSFTLWSIIPLFLIIIGIISDEFVMLIGGGILWMLGYFRYNHNNPLAKPWIRLIGRIVIILWIISLIVRASL